MPSNSPEYQKEYKQKHYAINRQKYIDQAAARRARLRSEVQVLKTVPCTDCDHKYPYWIMQFDHRDDDRNGEHTIGQLVARYNRKKVFEEIAKCDVVCANCHADRSYRRSQATLVFNGQARDPSKV